MTLASWPRRVWPEFKNHKLKTVCEKLDIELNHHNALSDARAAGTIISKAIIKNQVSSIEELYAQARKSGKPYPSSSVKMAGNPEGPLYGETIVLTGKINIRGKDTRQEIARALSERGANIQNNISKKTTMLIVGGFQRGKTKSNKWLDAEDRISKGQELSILLAEDFESFLDSSET